VTFIHSKFWLLHLVCSLETQTTLQTLENNKSGTSHREHVIQKLVFVNTVYKHVK